MITKGLLFAFLIGIFFYINPIRISPLETFPPESRGSTDLRFNDVTDKVGLSFQHSARIPQIIDPTSSLHRVTGHAASIAVIDYNNDGYQDIFISSPTKSQSKLFRNDGGLKFIDVTAKSFSQLQNLEFITSSAWIDLDRDGKLDLFLGTGNGAYAFIQKNDFTFSRFEIPDISPELPVTSINFYDVNKDGHLDFLLGGFWSSRANQHGVMRLAWDQDFSGGGWEIYLSKPAYGFQKVFKSQKKSHVLSMSLAQLNAQRGIQLLVGNDFGAFEVINVSASGEIEDLSSKWVRPSDSSGWNMGLSVGDIDLDGTQEIYQSNTQISPIHKAPIKILRWNIEQSKFESLKWPIRNCGLAWGSLIVDLNSDFYPEVVVANGMYRATSTFKHWPATKEMGWTLRNISRSSLHYWLALQDSFDWASFSVSGFEKKCLFQFRDGHWANVAEAAQLEFSWPSRAVAKVDFNNDGLMDLVFLGYNGPAVIYQNFSTIKSETKWVGLEFENQTQAYGAKVEWRVGDKKLELFNWPNNGTNAQHDPRMVLPWDHNSGEILLTFQDGTFRKIKPRSINAYQIIK